MKKLIYVLGCLSSTTVFAYNDHSSWSTGRTSYTNTAYQFTTGMQALQSTLSMVDSETNEASSLQYRGIGFKSSIGTEIGRFVRFDVFNTYQDCSADPMNSLRGAEIGGDVKLSFAGPVLNINFGAGAFASSLVNQTALSSYRYYGQGFLGSVEIEKFISPGSSISLAAEGKQQTLKPELTSVTLRPELNTVGLSINVTLWLNSSRY